MRGICPREPREFFWRSEEQNGSSKFWFDSLDRPCLHIIVTCGQNGQLIYDSETEIIIHMGLTASHLAFVALTFRLRE